MDHINRQKEDNRPCNLRWVTHAENLANLAPPGKDVIQTIIDLHKQGKSVQDIFEHLNKNTVKGSAP